MNPEQAREIFKRTVAVDERPVPTALRFGPRCRRLAPGLVGELGRRPLVMTTRSAMQAAGFLDELLSGLRDDGLDTVTVDGLDAGPTTVAIDAAADVARRHRADCVVALGGGSVIDGAKALTAVVGSGAACADLLHGRAGITAALPLLALPSTAGTGSEMNRSAILTDPADRRRDGLRSDHLFPRHAVVDPEICATQPPSIAARTAFDAMSHAIESFLSPRARPDTDELAEAAITLISGALVPAAQGSATPDQHSDLALSAAMMGVNLSVVGTCLPHRVDKAVCALHADITHGQCVAFFYPTWVRLSAAGSEARFAKVARILDPSSAGETDLADASGCSALIAEILDKIGLGKPPSAFGVVPGDIPRIIERMTGDLSANPFAVSPGDLKSFLEETIR